MKKPTPNPAYDQTVAILREAGYQRLSDFNRERLPGYIIPETHFEVWGGAKGTLILQVWKDGNGVATYADWPLGHTFDELKAAIAAPVEVVS